MGVLLILDFGFWILDWENWRFWILDWENYGYINKVGIGL
jgi:hypothetical protein